MQTVKFPEFIATKAKMMPIVMGDAASVPIHLHGFIPMINLCNFEPDTTVYLTVHCDHVNAGSTLRRGGAHVESPPEFAWGGKPTPGWGGGKADSLGIYMASTDGRTRIWRDDVTERGPLGEVEAVGESFICGPNELHHIGDMTPHEALPAESSGPRQFFRLVSCQLGYWHVKHNTPNPLGVLPGCPLIYEDKFAAK